MASKDWLPIWEAPEEAYERWQEPHRLLLRADGQVTIGYRERLRSAKTRWRTITGNIIEPDAFMEIPE